MSVPTLVDLLQTRAEKRPEHVVFRFLERGEVEAESLTYAELDARARAVAARLGHRAELGERALLLFPPGLDFVVALFGCLYVGVVAVPCYPPTRKRGLDRVRAFAADADAALVLTTREIIDRLAAERSRSGEAPGGPEWLAALEGDPGAAEGWRRPEIDSSTLAFLQYTSGSTAAPKGVMVTHENVLRNQEAITAAFAQSEASVVVGWLPLYHDMGLIGNVLQPLYTGSTCVLMAPLAFLQKPVRWLQAITRYRATTSGGPDFAYGLCTRNVTEAQRRSLDLSSWTVAFDGAESVRAATLEGFARAFRAVGFDPGAFRPCYGLAESTLFVACASTEAAGGALRVATESLSRGRVATVPEDRPGVRLVSCGRAADRHEVAIVDPDAGRPLPEGYVGEIWVRGPSVAGGYWNRPEETAEVFNATLRGRPEAPFLRTGDLGFLHGGRLFVTGRRKDLLILRGRNVYPQDLEGAAEACHPALRPNAGAAFSVEVDGQERLHIVLELERGRPPGSDELQVIVEAVRRRLSEEHEVHAYGVILAPRGAVPRTSSGKVRRAACRDLFLAGEFDTVAAVVGHEPGGEDPEPGPESGGVASPDRDEILELIRCSLAKSVGTDAEAVAPDAPLTGLGLDSLAAVELKVTIEERLAVAVPLDDLLEGASARELADRIAGHPATRATARGPRLEVQDGPPDLFPLSHGQRALWFLQQLAPEGAAYHIVAAALLRGPLDAAAFRHALQELVDRHPALRTTFHAPAGEPVQRVHEQLEPGFLLEDATGWTEEDLRRNLGEEAYRPFDLERGPLVRCALYRRSEGKHALVLAIHHLIADFWSLALLTAELDRNYRRFAAGAGEPAPALAPPSVQVADFIRWQGRLVASPRGEELWRYWRERLDGGPPYLDLPTDRPRPRVQTYRGRARSLRLGPEPSAGLRGLASAQGATLNTVLLAGFLVLLHRYAGKDDLVCGSPAAGRILPELDRLVGYLVNPLVLRVDVGGDPPFDCLLARVRRTLAGALEHQEYPFALLAERLQPERDPARSPLFQAMFVFQRAQRGVDPAIAGLALGEAGARARLADLEVTSLKLDERPAQFDLTLSVAEVASAGLTLAFNFNSDLFDDSTAGRLLDHFGSLLQGILESPDDRIGRLPLLTAAERRQLAADLASTARDIPRADTVVEPFLRHARQRPDAAALVSEHGTWTYAELAHRAARIAGALDARALVPGSVVGLHAQRTPEMVAALWGILAAGHAYLPLDPSYPSERLRFMVEDAGVRAVVTRDGLPWEPSASGPALVPLDGDPGAAPPRLSGLPGRGRDLAYVNYTSGSTGRPKGVLVSHRSVLNFFAGMDERVGCGPDDTLLAVTSISFDISVLELIWTLTRGARVVLFDDDAVRSVAAPASRARASRRASPCDLSVFYFASQHAADASDSYRLLLDGARLADRNGFRAVWTPERHFHAFGGLYPNPSVTSAALATITESVGLRAGSVVLPLHDPIRVAEEWAVVDNLSRGRVALAFASGWHADDFVLAPDRYADRKEVMYRNIETVRRLWRGEPVRLPGGSGKEVEVSILPRPVQPELPVWITAAESPETFTRAGSIGANVLTHLLGQSVDDLAQKIGQYRRARQAAGHPPEGGQVTLMLHAFAGIGREEVRGTVREPFTAYLRSSLGLIRNLVRSLDLDLDLDGMSPSDLDELLAFAFDRYFETSALFGDLDACVEMLETVHRAGVDEVACLVDFGVPPDAALESLDRLATLLRHRRPAPRAQKAAFLDRVAWWQPTLFQCTPSFMAMLTAAGGDLESLRCLRELLLGGETLPPPLARQLVDSLGVRVVNLFGPTETTVWSATHAVEEADGNIPIGRAIVNTRIHVLSVHLEPVPPRAEGELFIGGDGLARGYHRRPGLTAERFVPDPWLGRPGARLYRTGDLGSRRPDGILDFHGRSDHQVKVRGHRVELGEIESALLDHPYVAEAAVRFWGGTDGPGLVGYVVPPPATPAPKADDLRAFLAVRLPEAMLPGRFVSLAAMPRTLNGKVDRAGLPAPDRDRPDVGTGYVEPSSDLERQIAAVWREVLKVERVGVRDNFFDLGGHSLLMAVAHRKLQGRLGIEVPLVKLIEHPNVAALAAFLGRDQAETFSVDAVRARAQMQVAGRGRRRSRVLERVRRT